MLTYVVFSKAVCQTCLRRPDLHRVSRLTCLNLNFRHIYSDCSKSICSILHTVRMPRMTSQVIYFVTEQMTQTGSASPGSSACFSIKYVYSEEGGGFGCSIKGVRQTHPLTRPSQLWLGLAWLAHRLSQWRSCESTHTHTVTNTVLEQQHAHTRFHRTEVCALLIMPVTWKHNKVESICLSSTPPLHGNTNALF